MFSLPNNGASGVFANGSRSMTVLTDSQGRAVARGLKLNKASGEMKIHVNASYQGQTASTDITQTNTVAAAGAAAGAAAASGMSGKMIAILVGIAAAGAAGGAIAATRGGNSPTAVTPAPSTTITPGTGTVGAPH
ncbi:MAG: hypothetical protein HYX25_08700 [Candidatus Solibacter usitatus]|nr:hypothetical protein [Candidatus Solibacter usitatus]